MTSKTTRSKAKPKLGAVPWDEVGTFDHLINEFMFQVFDLTPDQFMVTDASRLSDFRGLNDLDDFSAIREKVLQKYRLDLLELDAEGNILAVIKAIARRG